mmetsp:Transcript_43701/g.87487  ORF Transcript_43701/g.87487 Transcript_43701/m.87487 type:complete len:80 (-) Transcript_43701:1078-1317(-)
MLHGIVVSVCQTLPQVITAHMQVTYLSEVCARSIAQEPTALSGLVLGELFCIGGERLRVLALLLLLLVLPLLRAMTQGH